MDLDSHACKQVCTCAHTKTRVSRYFCISNFYLIISLVYQDSEHDYNMTFTELAVRCRKASGIDGPYSSDFWERHVDGDLIKVRITLNLC